jgi:hypothetical protein
VTDTPNQMPELTIWPTDIPGLYDAQTPTGQILGDLTVGQVRSLAGQSGWIVKPGYPQ